MLVSSLFPSEAFGQETSTTLAAGTSSAPGSSSSSGPATSSTSGGASSTVVSSSTSSAASSTTGATTTGATTTGAAGASSTLVPAAPTSSLVPVAVLRQGSKGDSVESMEQKLDLLRYDVGKVDGRFDGQTWQGLMAFQKLHGLKRTGKFDLATQQELATSSIPGGLIPNGGLPRIEVDISRQILMYFDNYGLNRVVAISSGSGKKYCETSKTTGKPNCGDARTPRGNYRIERRIKGVRESDLGSLWSPMYFTGGFAIHGSPSIPAYAASHGCVRVTNRTADWMFESVKNGTPVYVFD